MPARQMPTSHIHMPVDNRILDEDFDMFDLSPPYDTKPDTGRLALIGSEDDWDEEL